MLYRDLIPSRLGGRYIASHISIPEGGPVADWVHFHRVAFQMIYFRRGWVRLVYEGQGDPFVMHQGDLVLQPPQIRHRVLESSDGLEVVEISAPALHATFADHEIELPGGKDPDRLFGGQRFLRHVAAEAPWTPFNGGEAQETAMTAATGGIADVRTVRAGQATIIEFPAHEGELVFGFVLEGAATLDFCGQHLLRSSDAFVIPPGQEWRLTDPSPDLRLLHVTTARLH
jgi:quercetin dioxygenase-like cupin family protein